MTARADRRRPRPRIGLGVLEVPPVPASGVRDCLTRLPVRRDVESVEQVGGVLLWLPRLGVTVLPHEPVTDGWVCTLVAFDPIPQAFSASPAAENAGGLVVSPGRLPTGVFVIADLEVTTAIAVTNPWWPTAELSVAEFGDAWRVRLACLGGHLRVGAALLAALDPDTLTVDVADRRVWSRSGCRHPAGFAQVCRRLHTAGLLQAQFDDTIPADAAAAAGPKRYGLLLPPAPHSWTER